MMIFIGINQAALRVIPFKVYIHLLPQKKQTQQIQINTIYIDIKILIRKDSDFITCDSIHVYIHPL